jgi:hypothetical protein
MSKKVISLGSKFENAGIYGCSNCVYGPKDLCKNSAKCKLARYTMTPAKVVKKK